MKNLLLASTIVLALHSVNAEQSRMCQACDQLGDVIDKGLKATKHKEGSVEEHGRLDSQGIKKGKKVEYTNSEARLVEILEGACSGATNKAECYQLINDGQYYEPIKQWFVSGRKGPFVSAVCPNCSSESSTSAPLSSAAVKGKISKVCCNCSAWVEKLVSFLPAGVKENAFIKSLPAKAEKMQHYAHVGFDHARSYSQVASRHVVYYSKRFNKQLDKLPVRKYIDKLPLALKTALFVEQYWKLIVLTLFLALLLPMYFLSCKKCGSAAANANGRRRGNHGRSPVMRSVSGKKSD